MKALTTCRTVPVIATLLAVMGSPAHADYSAHVSAGASASIHAGSAADAPADVSLSSSSPLQPLKASQQATMLDPSLGLTESSGGSGWAWVEPGGVHLTAIGTASVQGGPEAYDPGGAEAFGYASGGFSETTVWNISGVAAGQVVTVDFQVRIDGATGVNMTLLQGGTASGYRIYDWDVRFGSLGIHSVTNSDQPDNFGVMSFSTQVTVGAPMTLSIAGSVAAHGQAGILCSTFWGYVCDPYTHGASVTGLADLGHTLAWNGVTAIYLGDNALPLSALSVTSDSGFDYGQAYVEAVPEPSSIALWFAGLLLLPWLQARARSSNFSFKR